MTSPVDDRQLDAGILDAIRRNNTAAVSAMSVNAMTALVAAASDATHAWTTPQIEAAAAGSQPLDADLTAIAASATTPYGRAFLALADATAARNALSLGTLATQNANAVTITGGTATGIYSATFGVFGKASAQIGQRTAPGLLAEDTVTVLLASVLTLVNAQAAAINNLRASLIAYGLLA